MASKRRDTHVDDDSVSGESEACSRRRGAKGRRRRHGGWIGLCERLGNVSNRIVVLICRSVQ